MSGAHQWRLAQIDCYVSREQITGRLAAMLLLVLTPLVSNYLQTFTSVCDWLETGCLQSGDLWNCLSIERGHPEVEGAAHSTTKRTTKDPRN